MKVIRKFRIIYRNYTIKTIVFLFIGFNYEPYNVLYINLA